jgi:discoidin domain receptor family member 2
VSFVICSFFRLRSERGGGGWCPKAPVEKGVREFLQVDLGQVHVVSGIETQGRYNRGRGLEYVEEYTIEYWRPGLPEWHTYRTWDLKEVSTKILIHFFTVNLSKPHKKVEAIPAS